MAREIAFATFLKLLQLDGSPRRAELKRLLVGGGYPYWRPLQSLASQAILAGASLENLNAKVGSVCTGHQEKYNKNGLKALFKWAQDRSCKPADPIPEIVAKFGSSGLAVRLKPELSFELNGNLISMALWATIKPALSDEVLSIGLFFMKRAYEVKGHTQRQFLLFDTTKDRVFSEIDILSSTLFLLKSKHDGIKKDWAETSGVPPTPPSDDSKDEQPKLITF